jgi:hypothetical protein
MFNSVLSAWLRFLGGTPCFRIWGRGRRETSWRAIDVFATARRDPDSRWPWPLWQGTLITWTDAVIALGWDHAEEVLREQLAEPASRDRPVTVPGGRVDPALRPAEVPRRPVTASEVLAHECGHTWQARCLGWLYLPTGAAFTFWREGRGWPHSFENQASEEGEFGGLVNGSVCPALMERLRRPS